MKYHLLNDAIQFTNGNNKTFMDFLKQIDILDVIYWLEKAWSEVPQSALKGVWNKNSSKTFVFSLEEKIDQFVEKMQKTKNFRHRFGI